MTTTNDTRIDTICPRWCENPARLCGFHSSDGEGHDVWMHCGSRVAVTSDERLPGVTVQVTKDELRDEDTGRITWEPAVVALTVARAGQDGEIAYLSTWEAEHLVAGLQAGIRRATAADAVAEAWPRARQRPSAAPGGDVSETCLADPVLGLPGGEALEDELVDY